ncbi:MAG: pitrilysin family protein [Chitinophagaceae bacterium]
MIQYEKFTLKNGLRVIYHFDNTSPMVAVNVLYDVGARDEVISKTGFAHLFEHLMFGGSENIPEYDTPLQMAGGENNAYTTNDITNYYIQLPAENLETAFWLESDRMLNLAFNQKSLDVQRKVVCEEFKEQYINKPYGDVWKYLRELCYTVHPYQWMTIGKELKHIEEATLQDVKEFFKKHYSPINAILCVAGNCSLETVKQLCKTYFEPIPSGEKYNRNIPKEPKQTSPRKLQVQKDVPVSVVIKAFHMADRLDKAYYATDLITDILSGGQSSRLYQRFVKNEKLCSEISCYHTGSIDNGLIVFEAKLLPSTKAEDFEAALDNEIEKIKTTAISQQELDKVKNKVESMLAFEDLSLLSRANNLAYYELLGDIEMMNTEFEKYNQVNAEEMLSYAQSILVPENSNTLYYLSQPKQ